MGLFNLIVIFDAATQAHKWLVATPGRNSKSNHKLK